MSLSVTVCLAFGGGWDGFVQANTSGISSLPCFSPSLKCALQTLKYSFTGTFSLRILMSHFLSNAVEVDEMKYLVSLIYWCTWEQYSNVASKQKDSRHISVEILQSGI